MWTPTLLAVASLASQTPDTKLAVQELWYLEFSGARRFEVSPQLLALSEPNGVYANDPVSGESRWFRTDLGEGVSRPELDDDVVVVSVAKARSAEGPTAPATFALDANTGETLWRSPLGAAEGLTVVGPHVVGIGSMSSDGKIALVGLKRADGALAWTRELDGLRKLSAAPEPAGELVLCRVDETLVAVRASTGDVAWRSPSSELSMDARSNGELVVALGSDGEQGVVRGLIASSGARKWVYPLGAPATGLEIFGEQVLVFDWKGQLMCLELATGKERWSVAAEGGSSVDPLVCGQVVLVQCILRGNSKPTWRWVGFDLKDGAPLGAVLQADEIDTLEVGAGRLWWSRPKLGVLQSLALERKP